MLRRVGVVSDRWTVCLKQKAAEFMGRPIRLTEIAEQLHLSVKTISTHKSRIQEKLNLPTLADLVRYGLEHDLDAGGSVQVP